MPSKELTLINKLGLHARAAAKFVNLTSGFESDITLSRNGKTVNGKSIMGVMMLAASCGTTIEVNATGHDATEALQQIEQLVQDRFGEEA
jgi:phosphocarrier protein HPr